VSTTLHSKSAETFNHPWLAAGLELLAWCAHRQPLDDRTVRKLKTTAECFLPVLKEKRLDSLFYLTCAPDAPRQRLYDKVWAIQKQTLLEVGGLFAREGIDFYLFKGSESSERWYNSRALGLFVDIDMLVERADLGNVKAVLYGNGFRQAIFDQAESRLVDRDVLDVALVEGQHYELVPFRRLAPIDVEGLDLQELSNPLPMPLAMVGDQLMVAVELDVHHGVATDIEIDDMTDNAQPSTVGVGQTFSDSNLLWLFTSRYYTEVALHGKTSLRDFCYLLPIVAAGNVDWDVVLRAAHKYELRASLFYFLSFMSSLAGGTVPAEVLDELSPLNGTRMRDWGWQLGKLFDFLEEFPFTELIETRRTLAAEAGALKS
jgi:hypothetical protein